MTNLCRDDQGLNALGLHYGTDKGRRNHNYLRHYELLFAPRRGEPLTVFELGVDKGASVKMWRDYFHRSQIVGIDIEPRCREYAAPRLEIEIGSQDDPAFLRNVVEMHGPPDIVIEDASHNGDASRATFEILYPHVKPGGFYIVEDLHTSYFGWGSSFVEYAKHLADEVLWPGGPAFSHGHGDPRNHENWETIRGGMSDFCKQTRSMLLLSSLIVFEKWPVGELFE